jgi:hypothetical protein
MIGISCLLECDVDILEKRDASIFRVKYKSIVDESGMDIERESACFGPLLLP